MKKKYTKILTGILSSVLLISTMPFTIFGNDTSERESFYIVHVNDTHGRTNGSALTKGVVNYLESQNEDVLLLHAGDAIHGQSIASLTEGSAIIDIMNSVGYDYMAIGNHEFDYGFDRLIELEKLANTTYLSANIVYKDTNESVFKDNEIITLDNGLNVGIFGISTEETVTKTNPVNVTELNFLNPIEVANQQVKILNDEGADVIVMLSHLGVDKESNPTSIDVAKNVEGIDLIVDGHSHTELENGMQIGDTLIVQTGEYHNNIGLIEIIVEDDVVTSFSTLIPTDLEETPLPDSLSNVTPDSTVSELINKLTADTESITSKIVAYTDVVLDGERSDVRTKETNLSSIIGDAILDNTDSEIAFTNGGNIRTSIDKGDITLGEIISVLPFGNVIMTKDIPGNVILEMLEHGVDTYPDEAGHFLHVAGIKFEFNPNLEIGNRITSIKMEDGTNFDENRTYTVAMNEFLAAGGDGYTALADYPTKISYGITSDMLIDYINSGVELREEPADRMVVSTLDSDNSTDESSAYQSATDEFSTDNSDSVIHIVKEDDNLYNIANKYNISWQQIAKDNNLTSPYTIFMDDKLIINLANDDKNISESVSENIYIVLENDNLYGISKKYNMKWEEIAKINNISYPYIIYPEQKLIIR